MSESSYDFSQRSNPVSNFDIPEQYKTARGKTEEFGIEGYQITKKPDLLIIREHKIGKAKKRDLYFDISKKSKEPGPANYSPTHEKTSKEY